jgi:hypothetical protein
MQCRGGQNSPCRCNGCTEWPPHADAEGAGLTFLLENTGSGAVQGLPHHRTAKQRVGFYDYYRILSSSGADDDEGEDSGAKGKGELKGYMDGLHSPFGLIGQIKEKTGYSHEYVLWGQPWALLLMEAADAPRYVRGRRPAPVVGSADEVENILGNKVRRIR